MNNSLKEISNNLDRFSKWISSLSWMRFIFFIILISMISNFIQKEIFSYGENENWINSLTGIFIIMSFGMKVLMNKTVKAQIKEKEAILLAEKEALQRALSEAKLELMYAQIEPHFLFNTLSTLSYLISSDSKKANKMLLDLTTYLRYTLPKISNNKQTNNLSLEIEIVKAYLEIMKIRLGERLETEFLIDTELNNYQLPSMLLQKIIENSIKNGIENSIDGGKISIKINLVNEKIEIIIINYGKEFNFTKEKESQILLNDIKNRLDLLYFNNWGFSLKYNNNQELIKITIPSK